jgi:pentatricopeptide repeat protein
VIKAYSRVGNPEKADELIQELNVIASKPTRDGKQIFGADVMTLAAVINGYAKFRKGDDEKALERSEELLKNIIDTYREGKVRHLERNVQSWVFDDVIRLWSTSKRPDAGEHIMELIDAMDSLNKDLPPPALFEPSQAAYILGLDAWALTGRKDAGKYAMEVIKKMDGLVEQGRLAEITIRALSSALTSVTKAGGRGAVKSSEKLLRRIILQYKTGDRSASVNARTLTNVLSTMVRGAEINADERAIQLLREMTALSQDGIAELAPNTIVYNCVLNGLAKRGLADESLGLLEEMKLHRSNGLPCPPDIVSYSCVCRAIAASRIPLAVEKLEGILAEVVRVYKQGEESLKPDAYLFNAIIGGFAKVSKRDPSAAGKADELLKRMETSMLGNDPIAPDLVSFSSVCQAYAMSSGLNTAAKAADVLDRAEKMAANGLLAKPDTGLYSSVVLAYTKSVEQGNMEKAEAVVEKMEFLYKGGRMNVHPNARVFNLLLAGYANSRDPNKVSKVSALFAKLNKLYEDGHRDCEPDVNAYNWVRRNMTLTCRKRALV